MAENRIEIGNDVYTDSNIRNGNVYLSSSLAADELRIGTFDFSSDSTDLVPTIFKPLDADGFMTSDGVILGVLPNVSLVTKEPINYQYGQSIYFYHGNDPKKVFYLFSVERTGIYTYKISCVDVVGLLDNSTHYGGVYDGITFEELAKDIVGDNVVCNVENSLKDILIYGYLPISTRRENLHQLLFATGTVIVTGEYNGKPSINIKGLTESDPQEVTGIYIGGSIDVNKQINRVIVSEHAYIKVISAEQEKTLYEGSVEATYITTPNGDIVNGTLVTFSNPVHSLSLEGEGEILEEHPNYAVLAPTGYCKLVGYEYNHTTRQITREVKQNARSLVSVQDNDAVVDNATLVSLANSENVADRVMAYYTSAKNIKVSLVSNGEAPGERISFDDPFQESATGYIKSMDITLSGKLKANCEVVEGYVPTGIGNNYKNVYVAPDVHNWLCPYGVTKIRLVLIGGGQGGYSGYPGQDGTGGFLGGGEGEDGEGGDPGQGGSGGNIYITTVDVVPGKFYDLSFGQGGSGGNNTSDDSTPGYYGGDTTFSNEELGVFLSSASGSPSPNGYIDVIEGNVYAKTGKVGLMKGGKRGESIRVGNTTYSSGPDGESVDYETSTWSATAFGGHGGGPAYGGTGSLGGNGVINKNGAGFSTGGKGGGGGNAISGDNATGIGEGGQGGSGGGGGGAGGDAWHSGGSSKQQTGAGGKGGKGGAGGRGGKGGIIIYY